MGQGARLELRMDPEDKAWIERAAALTGRSLTAFATEVVVARSGRPRGGAGGGPAGVVR
jgi:uncharacterized protein (DUF1778 family)